ncbi:MAG: tRNA (guanosine(37)-N1)-methyltransferase TrmD [Nitrospinota bacterium]
MQFEILTVFPRMFDSALAEGVVAKGMDRGLIRVRWWDLRQFAGGRYRQTDDYPYGGGSGMVMKPEPIARALDALQAEGPRAHVVLLTPQGVPFRQERAAALAERERVALLCGRYEGVDERIRLHFVDEELSVGDYVLTGGGLPALVVLDAVARLVPGVLGSAESTRSDSFADGVLENPHYTRPAEFRGHEVPGVLLSGDHAAIRRWRRREALRRTRERRPDLLTRARLSPEDRELLEGLG